MSTPTTRVIPDFDVDYWGMSSVALRMDGLDIVHVLFDAETKWLHVRVFDSTHPESGIAWSGDITWDTDARAHNEEDCPACGAKAGEPCDPTALEDFCRTEGCDGDPNDGDSYDGYCPSCADKTYGSED